MGTMISMISKPHKWLTNKRAAGMDEQRVLLYRGSRVNLEFHRSEDPFSCATISEESEVRSREIRPPLEKALETGISSRMRAHHHRLETWFRGTRGPFAARPILFIYSFFFPPYPQESSPLFIPQLLGCRLNFVTTMETAPRFENVAQICLFPSFPRVFPYITYDRDKMLA